MRGDSRRPYKHENVPKASRHGRDIGENKYVYKNNHDCIIFMDQFSEQLRTVYLGKIKVEHIRHEYW